PKNHPAIANEHGEQPQERNALVVRDTRLARRLAYAWLGHVTLISSGQVRELIGRRFGQCDGLRRHPTARVSRAVLAGPPLSAPPARAPRGAPARTGLSRT